MHPFTYFPLLLTLVSSATAVADSSAQKKIDLSLPKHESKDLVDVKNPNAAPDDATREGSERMKIESGHWLDQGLNSVQRPVGVPAVPNIYGTVPQPR